MSLKQHKHLFCNYASGGIHTERRSLARKPRTNSDFRRNDKRIVSLFSFLFLALFILLSSNACSADPRDGPPKKKIDISKIKNPIPKILPRSKSGNSKAYVIHGKTYHLLKSCQGYHAIGYASWYGTKFNGKLTASGEPYDMLSMTAANKVVPIPCYVKVTNLATRKTIIVKINDRGPFKKGRIIDLSYVAALKLGAVKHGTAMVSVTAIDPKNNVMNEGMKSLYIQAAAYRDKHYADLFVKKLKALTKFPVIQTNHEGLIRIYIGPITRLNTALEIDQQLNHIGVKHPLIITNLEDRE